MKIFIIVAFCMALSACGNPIGIADINKSQDICKNNGGIDYIVVNVTQLNTVCKNTVQYTSSRECVK